MKTTIDTTPDALLVFTSGTAGHRRWYLAADFQHCITCVRTVRGWMLFEPLEDVLVVKRLGAVDPRQLASVNVALGRVVIAGTKRSGRSRLFNSPFRGNCVDSAKRLIGLDAPLVVTPRQLYFACMRQWGFSPFNGQPG